MRFIIASIFLIIVANFLKDNMLVLSIVFIIGIICFLIYAEEKLSSIAQIEKKLDENDSRIATLQKEREEVEQQEQEMEERKNKLSDASVSIEAQEEKLKEIITQINSNNSTMQEQIEVINNRSAKMEELSQSLQRHKDELDRICHKHKEISCYVDKKHELEIKIQDLTLKTNTYKDQVNQLMKQNDLYSRIDEFVSYGHYETPDYIYQTSSRFNEEIKIIRDEQKAMISAEEAIIIPEDNIVAKYTNLQNTILKNMVKLMLRAFNTECDFLIERVTPSNFSRTLEQINRRADEIEKMSLTLEMGFNQEYIKLKFKECELVYQYKIKKQQEKGEQELIKLRIKEEQETRKEYDKAIEAAKKEEDIYKTILERVQLELQYANSEDKELKERQITELQLKLKEVVERKERAISLAQQTKKGYIYIISNIGSFGENVYKIGMTRRFDPMDRVKELGDASVPFKFDVHAIIYCEDAPNVEYQLHKYFLKSRINAVNPRKEFFRTSLDEIKSALDKIVGGDYDFKTTILAEEYFESLRLQG